MKLQNMLPILVIMILGISITLEVANPTSPNATTPIIADHTIVNMVRSDQIPKTAIIQAKQNLHIAYGHTSHGSQVITGMSGLPAFKESQNGTVGLYNWHDGPQEGALDIDDYFVAGDLGNPDWITWANRTREYLHIETNSDVNVVMWSWCGEVSYASEDNINTYLTAMTELENEFPNIIFVYMTGHTDGTGLDGTLHIRNEQIRQYVRDNNKVLFDFADIESYDPNGTYFGDKHVTDSCNYDGGNWAIEWQDTHPGEWYDCYSAHSQPLNANMKAYAAWWLFAKLAGWETVTTTSSTSTTTSTTSTTTSTTSTTTSTTSTTTSTTSTTTSTTSSIRIRTAFTQDNTANGWTAFTIITSSISVIYMKRHKIKIYCKFEN